jgi:AsmA-like C-terminal region
MQRKTIRIVVWSVAGFLVLAAITTAVLTLGRRKFVKDAVVHYLSDRFDSEVQIRDISVWIFPRVYVVADGIVLRHKGRTDIPPLLIADKITITADLHALTGLPIRVANVQLTGFQLHIPPRNDDQNEKNAGADRASENATTANAAQEKAEEGNKSTPKFSAVIAEVDANDAVVVMLPKDPKKIPLEFDIHHLVVDDAGSGGPAEFHATLRNPKPVGDIATNGHIGPWNAEQPSLTPVDGNFSFSNADLGTLKGISGILSSKGSYSGALDSLNVQGDTDTPDFALQFSSKPVDLKTHYVVVVDGTNGNTYLKSVTAHFLHSTIETNGEVVKVRGAKHRHILLNGDQQVMTGSVNLNAKIDIPPDDAALFDKLILKGRFGIEDVHFANNGVQSKVDSLSRHGQGEPKNMGIEDVISNLEGQFGLANKVATFSNLVFDVQGAKVQLAGTYNLEDETLDFQGHLLLNAQLSQLTTGVKSVFLKPFDSFFRKNGAGTSLPIRITGTRTNPSFGLDFNNKKNKKDKPKPGS